MLAPGHAPFSGAATGPVSSAKVEHVRCPKHWSWERSLVAASLLPCGLRKLARSHRARCRRHARGGQARTEEDASRVLTEKLLRLGVPEKAAIAIVDGAKSVEEVGADMNAVIQKCPWSAIDKQQVIDLQRLCEKAFLNTNGNQAELVKRLGDFRETSSKVIQLLEDLAGNDTEAVSTWQYADGLSEQQAWIVDQVLESKKSIFLTGKPGSGKTVVLQAILKRSRYDEHDLSVNATALTGVASLLLPSATTLHSFAGLNPDDDDLSVDEVVERIIRGRGPAVQRWKRCKLLLIDEVSMMSRDLMEKVDAVARAARGVNKPFGGIQVVLCGDFRQLPPVDDTSGWCFESPVWRELLEPREGPERNFALTSDAFRHTDERLATLLREVLEARMSSWSKKLLEELERPLEERVVQPDVTMSPTRLYALNDDVDEFNERCLEMMGHGQAGITYDSDDFVPDELSFTDEDMEDLFRLPSKLRLKKGAQVILLQNLDTVKNGSRGVVCELKEDGVVVEFFDGTRKLIEPMREIVPVEIDSQMEEAERYQIPLRLAWAMTIHKAQGMTFEFLEVSLKNVFAPGQSYVALSRGRTCEGLRVLDWDVESLQFSYSPEVEEFYKDRVQDVPFSEKVEGAESNDR